jgi:5-methyltetrahydropteroyltriglutamate--homocysteine methyltransferase
MPSDVQKRCLPSRALVADRIVRFAEAVSRENVVASTDCGLGGRVHRQIAWAKPDTLVKVAELATSQLWG